MLWCVFFPLLLAIPCIRQHFKPDIRSVNRVDRVSPRGNLLFTYCSSFIIVDYYSIIIYEERKGRGLTWTWAALFSMGFIHFEGSICNMELSLILY